MPKKPETKKREPKCSRAFSHRPGVYCSTCGKTAKVKGE